ncbi:MAG TPA: aldolase/citrate lyase family protein [Opitutaceae bacterium]|nr:aldolase/citrate lyase family protein [Opitutaceae bacterium]
MNLDPKFRGRVRAGERLAGTFLNLGSSLTTEMAGVAGFDWLLLDHEHGPGGEETLLHQLQAASATPAYPIVRIAANETPRFKRVLDIGAGGVMVPWVNTAAEAQAAAAAMQYPPRGVRGVAKMNRACDFGLGFADYYAHAHERLVLMAQIETPTGVQNAGEIATVDGVDVLFIGPADLTTSLGIQDQFEHPTYRAAVKRIAEAARAAGKATGILLLNPAQLPICDEFGITVIALGSDGGMVNAGLRANAAAIRKR